VIMRCRLRLFKAMTHGREARHKY